MFFGYKLEDIKNPFYSHLLRWNNSHHIKNHFSENVKGTIEGYDPLIDLEERLPRDFHRLSPLAKAQWLETTVFMSGYLLSSQGDRMAMANSVEGRYPFLDYRVIEFCNRLPDSLKLNGLNEKYLLKKETPEGQNSGKHFKKTETAIQGAYQQRFHVKRKTRLCI